MDIAASPPPPPLQGGMHDEKLRDLSRSLEAGFLAEMLKSAGLGETRSGFSGGIGEDQFSSLLVQEYADAASRAGGIGLSEAIYRSLLAAEGRAP